MNLYSRSLRIGFLRIAIVSFICWSAGVTYLHGRAFCAATHEMSDKDFTAEIEGRIRYRHEPSVRSYTVTKDGISIMNPATDAEIRSQAIMEGSLEHLRAVGGKAYNKKHTLIPSQIFEDSDPTSASTDCSTWTTPDEAIRDRDGGSYPNWSKRADFIVLLLGVPLAAAILLGLAGAAAIWIAKGFRPTT